MEYFKAYQVLQSNWREEMQFSFYKKGDCDIEEIIICSSIWVVWFVFFCKALSLLPVVGLLSPSGRLMFLSTVCCCWRLSHLHVHTHVHAATSVSFWEVRLSAHWACEVVIVLSLGVLICARGGRPSCLQRSVSCGWSCVDQMSAMARQIIFIKAALGKRDEFQNTPGPLGSLRIPQYSSGSL